MRLPTITGVQGLETDGKGKLTFQFKSADGRSHYVPMKEAAINAMLPVILNTVKSTTDDSGSIEVQPVTLTAVRSAVRGDGLPMLQVHLDGVPLCIGLGLPGAIPKLLKILSELQAQSGSTRH